MKLIRKGILFVIKYPLFSVGIVMAGLSVAAAAAGAVALPMALVAIGTLLPLIMFASFGALFAATAAAMVALTVLGPFLLSFSFQRHVFRSRGGESGGYRAGCYDRIDDLGHRQFRVETHERFNGRRDLRRRGF